MFFFLLDSCLLFAASRIPPAENVSGHWSCSTNGRAGVTRRHSRKTLSKEASYEQNYWRWLRTKWASRWLDLSWRRGKPTVSRIPQKLFFYEIVISLQLCLSLNDRDIKFLSDQGLVTLKNTLDRRMKDLASQGVCVKRKQAHVISEDKEEIMWT